MQQRDPVDARRTPRPPSAVRPWIAPVRNHDWIAARIGRG